MVESIDKCYICGLYFEENVLTKVNVPDQVGHIQKPVCKGCLKEIEERSNNPVSAKKPKQLLMEEQG